MEITSSAIEPDNDTVLYHYTTIETLALILKNKTIRFNRLDNVDDLEEAYTTSQGINLSKYVFVSCWSETGEESIPQWRLYANGQNGIRISLEKKFFEEYIVSSTKEVQVEAGSGKYLLPLEQMLTNKYMFLPPVNDSPLFYKKIVYVEDVFPKRDEIAKLDEKDMSIGFGEVGSYKNKRWAFQDEVRFRLVAIPNPQGMSYSDPQFSNLFRLNLKNNIELSFDHYDLKIKNTALDTLGVTLCPTAGESQKILVSSLLNQYAPQAVVEDSAFKGCVRFR